jgi:hypothetical protein
MLRLPSGFWGRGRAVMRRSLTWRSSLPRRKPGANGCAAAPAPAPGMTVARGCIWWQPLPAGCRPSPAFARAGIGQLLVAPGANEITAALALLKSLPLAGTIVTGDAEFCQRAICQSIRDRGGDYLVTIKANQPRLMADIAIAFGDAFPPWS